MTSVTSFLRQIEASSARTGSKIVLALDVGFTPSEDSIFTSCKRILDLTANFVCAVKLNFHVILPLSLTRLTELNSLISHHGLCSIADIKLNDIDNTNRVTTEYLWNCGFSAVIANPFVGYEGALDVVFKHASELGKGVITLAYMSHKGANETFGLELAGGKSISDLFIERANAWGSDGVILGSTRPARIQEARRKLHSGIKIFSPGSGAQGGDALEALEAGADYLIFGRSIVAAEDPKKAAELTYQSLSNSAGRERS